MLLCSATMIIVLLQYSRSKACMQPRNPLALPRMFSPRSLLCTSPVGGDANHAVSSTEGVRLQIDSGIRCVIWRGK